MEVMRIKDADGGSERMAAIFNELKQVEFQMIEANQNFNTFFAKMNILKKFLDDFDGQDAHQAQA